MTFVAKSYSEVIFLLRDDDLDSEDQASDVDEHEKLTVCLGDAGAIKLFPCPNAGAYVRVFKHRRSEDLFPSDFIVESGGIVRVHNVPSKRDFIGAGQYHFEVHVDEANSELLQVIDWNFQSFDGRSSQTTLCPEIDTDFDSFHSLRTGIFIKSETGNVREYTNDRIELRVVSFEVVDENGDGIFEPGGFIRVENIKVKNLGMIELDVTDEASLPSPKVSLSIKPTQWLHPVGSGVELNVVNAGEIVALDGYIRGYISPDAGNELLRTPLLPESVVLAIDLGDLVMRDVSQETRIWIQYPFHFEIVQCPKWISASSTAEISWKITNLTNTELPRALSTSITIIDPNNTLQFVDSVESRTLLEDINFPQPNEPVVITKALQSTAIDGCSAPVVRFDLLTTEIPIDSLSHRSPIYPQLYCISTTQRRIVVANTFRPSDADLLVVANTSISESTIHTWRQVASDLGLSMDIYNFELYGTFDHKGQNVLEMYSGKIIVIMGNSFPKEDSSTSVIESLGEETTRLLAKGTTVLISDVEVSRRDEIMGRMGDMVHGTSPSIDCCTDTQCLLKCLQERHLARYIIPVRNELWDKLALKTLRLLTKHFFSRRFAVSKLNDSQICVRESLDFSVGFATSFLPEGEGILQSLFTLISILPFTRRLSLLWAAFRGHVNYQTTEFLTLSIAYDILAELLSGESKRLEQFRTYEPSPFDALSLEFVAIILSAVSHLNRFRSVEGKIEIQEFLERHYSPDLVNAMTLRLRWLPSLSLENIREKIAHACGMDVNLYQSNVLYSSEIGSQIRDLDNRLMKTDGRNRLEATFAKRFDPPADS